MSDIEDTGPGLERPGTEVYKPIEGVKIGNFKNHPSYVQKTPTHLHLVHVADRMTPGYITDMILKCHGAAWTAGWWHDPRTGRLLDRNAGEMLMLQVSELAEAAHGLDNHLKDDKLPHRQMVEVEIADFLIRLFDYCGGLRIDLEAHVARSQAHEEFFVYVHGHKSPALWQMTRHLCDAMEGHRKRDDMTHATGLARAYRLARWFSEKMGYDLDAAISEKMAYNATRADHKPEARLAPGGKAY